MNKRTHIVQKGMMKRVNNKFRLYKRGKWVCVLLLEYFLLTRDSGQVVVAGQIEIYYLKIMHHNKSNSSRGGGVCYCFGGECDILVFIFTVIILGAFVFVGTESSFRKFIDANDGLVWILFILKKSVRKLV